MHLFTPFRHFYKGRNAIRKPKFSLGFEKLADVFFGYFPSQASRLDNNGMTSAYQITVPLAPLLPTTFI